LHEVEMITPRLNQRKNQIQEERNKQSIAPDARRRIG
jgi:hypothetical protein